VRGKIAIICDFDGTVAQRDIGHEYFGKYVSDKKRWGKLLDEWKIGLISSRECLIEEIAMLETGIKELDSFIEKEVLDPYFSDFVDFCNDRKYEIEILSDGLDYYIDYLLMKFGLGFIRFKANHLLHTDGKIKGVKFPYYNTMNCEMCGNCKRKHVEDLNEKGFFTVYVGNGYSDRCPAEHADIVFAKADLLNYCELEGIEHIPFKNFRDVEREFSARYNS
jgi:2,3-diketo-5-methylthio-1-phosphopentane phosphatase